MLPGKSSDSDDSTPVTAAGSLVPPWFVLTTCVVIVLLFTVSYIVDMVSADYEVPGPIYGLVTLVVGSVVGSEAVKGLRR